MITKPPVVQQPVDIDMEKSNKREGNALGTLTIGKNKRKPDDREYSSMLAMPTPVGWGDKIRPAKGRSSMRLEKGEIKFEKIKVRLFADRTVEPESDKRDPMVQVDARLRRKILPVVEQSPWPEPPAGSDMPYRHVYSEIADYENAGDSDAIFDELREQLRSLSFRIVVSIISAAFLGAIEVLPEFGVTLPDMFLPDKAPTVYLTLNLFFLVFCGVLCRNVIIGGLKNLFTRKIDGDSLLGLGYTAVVIQTLAQLIACLISRQPTHSVCGAPAVMALLLNDIGLMTMVRRVARNFQFVALHGIRRAARVVDSGTGFDELLHADRKVHNNIVYTVRAKFLVNYLRFSYEEDYCEQRVSRIAPLIIPVAVFSGLIGGLISFRNWGVWGGIYCLCTALIAGVPVCRLVCLNLPMERASRRLMKSGIMLNGWAAIDEFGTTDALMINSDALFPEGTVRLISVKAFGETPIDRSVRYAAAVVLASGGPLAQVFSYLLDEGGGKILPADGIEYENELGVFGWVENKLVLVGNRHMMEKHGIELPSRDYEQLIKAGKSRHLVYIAISGKPCAVMLVQYRADINTAEAVRAMVSNGVGLLVYTTDPNVTGKLVSEIYEIPARLITILSVRAGSKYDELTHTIRDRAPAVLCTVGRLEALADGINASKRLRSMLMLTTMIQLICYGIGFVLTAGLSLFSGCEAVSPAQVLIMQLMCLLVSLVALIRKPV